MASGCVCVAYSQQPSEIIDFRPEIAQVSIDVSVAARSPRRKERRVANWVCCSGGVIEADVVRWTEAIWKRTRRRGSRAIKNCERSVTAQVGRADANGWLRLVVIESRVTEESHGRRVSGEAYNRRSVSVGPVRLTGKLTAIRLQSGLDGAPTCENHGPHEVARGHHCGAADLR
jgi:hypothetical protein